MDEREEPYVLRGIHHSNRKARQHLNRHGLQTSFPTAVACYMLEHDIPAVYVHLEDVNGKLEAVNSEIPITDVFNCADNTTANLDFQFESVYEPYQQYSFDAIDGIDLVVKSTEGNYLAPIEIKLTVLPTDATSKRPEEEWGCELVVRSATTSYCALGMFDAAKEHSADIREMLEDCCSSIQMWDNDFEMTHKVRALASGLDAFELQYHHLQKPLLAQTIWKTQGKSPLLAENAFDVFVWSDYAFSRLFIDGCGESAPSTMSRPMRATARLARCLWELSKSGKIRIVDIYRQMAFGNQTDKEFAVGGSKWRKYVTSDRVIKPAIPSSLITEIVQPEGVKRLSPERRFDQTLFFTVEL